MYTTKKIDLHVHSKYSNRPQAFMLSKVRTGECYTEPETVYEVCKERGMDLVTISDHDTIDGALEIAHLPDTFISEEITAIFKDDGTDVHVVASDINEAQHQVIQEVRYNIEELAAYLRSEQIPHFVAHALSTENKPLRPHHVERLLLLFKHFEGRNGTRAEAGGHALARLIGKVTPGQLSIWAEKHGIEPVDWDPTRYLVGGSDDHGRLSIASAYTEFETEAPGMEGVRDAFFAGRVAPGGRWGSGTSLSHTIYYVTARYFAETASKSAFSGFVDEDAEEELAEDTSPAALRHQVLMEIIDETLSNDTELSLSDLVDQSHKDHVQEALGEIGRGIVHKFLKHFFEEFIDAAGSLDLDRAFDAIPGILTGGSVLLPYLFGYRYFVRDRDESEELVAKMGFGYPEDVKPKVAIFSDTGFEANGVTLSLRAITAAMRDQGHDVELVFCDNPTEDQGSEWTRVGSGVRVLDPVGVFDLPAYDEYKMGIPSLVDVMEYLARDRVAVVQLSTPGPLGLVAGVAAKLMGIPVVANFHTEVHKFAERIIGDDKVTAIVTHWMSWFYRQMDKIIVPSQAAGESLHELGVDPARIVVLPRGVDAERFNSTKRDPACWESVGMNGSTKVLYVGRVSKEKGLDNLLDAFTMSLGDGEDEELVIIGDGPYLEELERRYAGYPVTFVRYRKGEQLAQMYASADLLAFPSENDTFGNVVLEAHASGLPVIVVDKGGPKEQVTEEVNGLVTRAGDVDQLSRAIRYLLDNPEVRQRMGRAGRERAEALDWRNAADAQWSFYMEVWGRAAREKPPQFDDRRAQGVVGHEAPSHAIPFGQGRSSRNLLV